MEPLYVIAVAFFPVLVGTLVIAGMLKSLAAVRNRPQVLAAAGAPLGLAPRADVEACARAALEGTAFPWANAVAAARGRTAQGEVTVVDLRFQTGGNARFSRLQTIAVYHGEHGLPRLLLEPSYASAGGESGLKELRFDGEDQEEALDAFGFSFAVHAADEAAARARLTRKALEAFNERSEEDLCLDVLPDRVAFCRLKKGIEPEDLASFLAEGRRLVDRLRGT